MIVLLAKLLVGVLAIVLAVILTRSRYVAQLEESSFRALSIAVWVLTRLGLFCAVFLIFDQRPSSDVLPYTEQATKAAKGIWIYRDFDSRYAPLFPYFLAAVQFIWPSAKAIVLLAVLLEGMSVWIWTGVAQHLFPPQQARRATLLYLASSTPLVNAAMEGQNQAWIAFFLALAVWLYIRGRNAGAGVALSGSVVLVKLLGLLFVPAFLVRNARRFEFIGGFAVLPAIAYGFLIANRIDVLAPLKFENRDQTCGSLPFLMKGLLAAVNVSVPKVAFDIVAGAVLVAIALWVMMRETSNPGRATVWSIVLIMTTFLLFSNKSYTAYLTMCLFPFCALFACRLTNTVWAIIDFGIFNLVATIERTAWFRWLDAKQLSAVINDHSVNAASVAVFIFLDIILLCCYVRFWWWAWTAIKSECPVVERSLAQAAC